MYDSTGRFRRFFPIDAIEDAESLLEKAEQAPKELPPFVLIKGFCSTERGGHGPDGAEDADGEVLVRAGMDVSPILQDPTNTITDGHPRRRDNGVGEVVSLTHARHPVGGDGFYLQGKLYCHIPRGRRILEEHCGLLKSGASRGLGMSVEGVVVERDPANRKRILKSIITSVAIDPYPKNRHAQLEEIAMAMAVEKGLEVGSLDPALLAEAMGEAMGEVFLKAVSRRDPKMRLADQFSAEHLMALTYLVEAPQMSLATALSHVRRFRKGEKIHG